LTRPGSNCPPPEGCRAWIEDEAILCVFCLEDWAPITPDAAPHFGINSDADATNRLAVKSDAVLFSHHDVTPGSGDMRHLINRLANGNTGSLRFQTGHVAGAEIGQCEINDFTIKVASDGQTWTTGLRLAASDGRVDLPAGFLDPDGILDALRLRYELGTIKNNAIATANFGDMVFGSVLLAVPNSLTSAPVALLYTRMATNPSLTTLFSDGAAFTVQTGELAGTTGNSGTVNLSVTDDGRFIVENRRGYAIAYTLYTFMR